MNWFEEDKTVHPTKMFVNYLPEGKAKIESKSLGDSALAVVTGTQSIALDLLITAAPKLIEQGMELISDTLNSFAKDKAFPTTLQRNFDIIEQDKLHLPSKITLVRGDFAPNKNMQGETFGDGKKQARNQAILSGDKELDIEIDIIQSKEDPSIFYFQANRYFHTGYSATGESIDELVVAFYFLPVGGNGFDSKLQVTSFLHFKNLIPNQEYNFQSGTGYDTSYQSSWVRMPFSEVTPYTIVVRILEIRKGNDFAKLLQTIYVENKQDIQTELNSQINNLNKERE